MQMQCVRKKNKIVLFFLRLRQVTSTLVFIALASASTLVLRFVASMNTPLVLSRCESLTPDQLDWRGEILGTLHP